jgi:hypothetical protein
MGANKMTIKEQFRKVTDNWILILLVLIIIVATGIINSITSSFSTSSSNSYQSIDSMGSNLAYSSSRSMDSAGYYPSSNNNFAPEVAERKITKSANLAAKVEKGAFISADEKLKNIVSMTNSYLLSENTYKNSYDNGKREYYTGQYALKVDSDKYAQIINELKAIGDIQSFNENVQDITGTCTNIETELAVERQRLDRYNELYASAQSTNEKISLVDSIFNEERTIKYLEDALSNQDNRVVYSTIYISITEKRSDYANIALVKFSNLIKSFVESFNSLLYLIFLVLPYAVAGAIIWFFVWLFRRKGSSAKKK